MPQRSPGFRVLLVLYGVACGGLAVFLWQRLRAPAPGEVLLETGTPAVPEQVWPHDAQYAVDAVVGHRPRSNHRVRFRMGPLHGEPEDQVRVHDDRGCIRLQGLGENPGAPRVLVVGDSHTMGVVSNTRNATHLLEKALRQFPGWEAATVINASAGYYSLYQYVLRARTLVSDLRPQWIVLAVFLGNDFLELEDVSRPHLDDEGRECPASPDPPEETTSARREFLGREESLFFQGLNQACYFHLHPGRLDAVEIKTRTALGLARSLAGDCGARLLVVQIPSYDQVFPGETRALGPRVAEVLESWERRDWPGRFTALLEELGIEHVDLLPAFRSVHDESLYAGDYHIFERGHEVLARALGEFLLGARPESAREELR